MEINNTINGIIDTFKRLLITQDFLTKEKVLEFWKNCFTDVDENVNNLYNELHERKRIRALKEILTDAYRLCFKLNNLLEDELRDSELTNERQYEEQFWDGLLKYDVHPKKVLCLLYSVIRKGNFDNCTTIEKELSLLSCAIYLNLLCIKGHGAFRIFQPSFIDEVVKIISANEANLKRPAAIKPVARRSRQKQTHHEEEFQEEILPTDNENEDNLPLRVSNCLNINLKIHLLKQILNALYKLVQKVSFRSYQIELRDLIKALIDLGLQYTENYQFQLDNLSINGMAFLIVKSFVLSNLHGNSEVIYIFIMESLLIQFLDVVMEKRNHKASNQLVQIKHFLVNLVNEGGQEVKKPSQIFFLQLCARVSDKTEAREKTAHQAYEIISQFPVELFLELVKWTIKHLWQTEINQRMVSLDVLCCLLQDETKTEMISVFPDTTPLVIIEKILNRCNDKSSTVVVKALSVLSQNKVLEFLTQNNQSLSTQRKLYKKLEKNAKYLAKNDKVFIRKSTLMLITRIMCQSEPEAQYYKIMGKFAQDPSVLIRKQTCESIGFIVQAHPESELAQNLFIQYLLPLLGDIEESAQQKCLEQLDGIILDGILTDNVLAWVLLSRISQANMTDYKGYVEMMLQMLVNNGRLRNHFVTRVKEKLTSEFEGVAWMLLALLTSCKDFPYTDYSFVMHAWREKKNHPKADQDDIFTNIVQTIGNCSRMFSKNAVLSLVEHFKTDIFLVPLVCITPTIIALKQMLNSTMNKQCYHEDVNRFAIANMKRCDAMFANFFETENFEAIDARENEASRIIEIYSILSEICPNAVTAKTQEYLMFLAFRKECNQIKKISILCLGRLCVQKEELTRKSLLLFVQELNNSPDPNVIINVLAVLCDFCNRYPSIVEPYLNNMSNCFRHPSKFVSYQALILFTRLLQEVILKWKGSLFCRFLYVIANSDPDLSLYAKSLLIHLVSKRYPKFFVQHFAETICFLNGLEKSLDPLKDPDDQHFTLKGDKNFKLRMNVYNFMIENTKPELRFLCINSVLIEHTLVKFLDREKEMNDLNKFVIKDTLKILQCEKLKDCTTFNNLSDEEGGLNPKQKAFGKKAKAIVVEKVINAIVGLKAVVRKTPVMKDYMQFLANYTKDFKNELKEMLAAEPQLAKEIQYDIHLIERERNRQPSPQLVFTSDED